MNDRTVTASRLDHLGLTVAELAAARTWFCEVFGMVVPEHYAPRGSQVGRCHPRSSGVLAGALVLRDERQVTGPVLSRHPGILADRPGRLDSADGAVPQVRQPAGERYRHSKLGRSRQRR